MSVLRIALAATALLAFAAPAVSAAEVDPVDVVRDYLDRCWTETKPYVDPLADPEWHVDRNTGPARCTVGWANPKAGEAVDGAYETAKDRTPLPCWSDPTTLPGTPSGLALRAKAFAWCSVQHATGKAMPPPK